MLFLLIKVHVYASVYSLILKDLTADAETIYSGRLLLTFVICNLIGKRIFLRLYWQLQVTYVITKREY